MRIQRKKFEPTRCCICDKPINTEDSGMELNTSRWWCLKCLDAIIDNIVKANADRCNENNPPPSKMFELDSTNRYEELERVKKNLLLGCKEEVGDGM